MVGSQVSGQNWTAGTWKIASAENEDVNHTFPDGSTANEVGDSLQVKLTGGAFPAGLLAAAVEHVAVRRA